MDADSVPFTRVLCRQALEHLRIDDDRCRIQVTDQGEGFDPALLTEQRPADLLDGGSGLRLMRALVDMLQFEQDPAGRHRVTFEKRLASPEALAVPPL